ncbi:protein LATERAL BRANCHING OXIDOREDUCTASE 1 [Typha latifolia]|uniref:protein LATERAL BRANCHING OXIDOREDUCTASE 1 n=1 Tax=Typha latifolia TaxID=4733 RepID=UPI003C2D1C00
MAPLLCPKTPEIKIGGHVQDVQELRRAQPTYVPERYVRDPDERPARSNILLPSSGVPVIDMSKLERSANSRWTDELGKLAAACEEWGFFQVVNHGIEEWLMESMEELTRDFFMLPLEEKEKYPMAPGTIQGYGHAFVFSEDQKLDWCNMLALGVQPAFIRNPRLWPTTPAHFSETLEIYSVRIRELCQKLLVHIAKTLGLAPSTFNDMFAEAVQAVRMNYYPQCPRPDLVLGLSSHSDGSALTVLQQDTGCIGLQILKDDAWIPIHPIPNALVINLGDTLEVLTNGKYKSVEHRAVTNEVRDRLSIVTFYAPSYEVELGPIPELVNNQPCKYKRYNHGEYSRHYVTNKLQGKKTLEFAKLQSPIST